MSNFQEYDQYDGLGLAALVRKQEITPKELIQEARRRMERINPRLNAVIHTIDETDDNKTDAAASPDARFDGVPFLLKDVHHALNGHVMSCGSNSLKEFIPSYDALIVKRFQQAGLCIIGKTNTPEFKLGAVTEPSAFGPTCNPWNTAYSCGGSSGGSAAAVAAGIVPMASGTDEGGSIRIPASYCGLFGLKPSRGRNPIGPDFDNALCGLSTSHVLTRSVRDSAAVLDAVSGPEPGGIWGLPKLEKSFSDAVAADPAPLRIAMVLPSAFGRSTSPECVKAVNHAAAILENLGHHVEPADPGYDMEEVVLTWCRIVIGHLAVYLDGLIKKGWIPRIDKNIELQNRTMHTFGKQMKSHDFVRAFHRCSQLALQMATFMEQYDLVLTPTLGEPPVKVGSQAPGRMDQIAMKLINSWVGKLFSLSAAVTETLFRELARNAVKGQMPYTMIANLTGQPAMSVPLYWAASGLPCGVQFIGRFGEEARMLSLAGQLEKAEPWFHKRPDMI